MTNHETAKIYKTGSALSSIQIQGDFINKTIRGLSLEEVKAIKEGIKVLEEKLPETILTPNTINEKKETGEDSYLIKYTQNLLKPWIDKEFISSSLLLKIAYSIIKQQTVLADHNLTLVDARTQNYWIFNKPYVLVDIGSIKPLNKKNIESFRADFVNNFVYPLLIEKNLGIPISSYFKGRIQNFQINPLSLASTWSSLTLTTEFIRREFVDFISNTISASSPEFISYLNTISDTERNEAVFQNSSKPKKLFKRYKKIIDRVSPSKNKKSNPYFFKSDIKNLHQKINDIFNVVYARFVLHALDEEESKKAIKWAFNHLEKGGLFLSESRSIKDSIFGSGDKVSDRIYKTSHQRRFLKKTELLKDLKDAGFIIDNVLENNGLAIYKDSDPVVIRITARKP